MQEMRSNAVRANTKDGELIMPSKQEVLAAIASGELFTPEYQERERQRKTAVMIERIERQNKQAGSFREQQEKRKAEHVDTEFNPYAGKKSGDYVGD